MFKPTLRGFLFAFCHFSILTALVAVLPFTAACASHATSAAARVELVSREPAAKRKSPRILFIGNSLTGFNNMPGLFLDLAKQKGFTPEVWSYLKFGQTLGVHLADPELRSRITDEKWDEIVLQDYSDLAIRDPQAFLDDVSRFRDLAKPSGARLVLFENWPYRDAPAGTMDEIDRRYQNAASEVGAAIAPLGPVMNRVASAGRVDVYAKDDDKHPSVIGTYLGAVTFLNFFFGINPHSVPHIGSTQNTPDVYGGRALAAVLTDLDQMYSPALVRSVQSAVETKTCISVFK